MEPLVLAAMYVQKYQQKGKEVMVTGHSLGGYMAEVLASNCGISGIGFCAPGSGWHKGTKGGEGKGFQNINFEHDRAGNVMPGVFEHTQWSVYVQVCDGGYHHSMELMLEMMTKPSMAGCTNLNVLDSCSSCWTGYYVSPK